MYNKKYKSLLKFKELIRICCLEINQINKMPKLQNWKFLTEVTVTEEEFKQYANMQLCASIQRRNKDNCTKCDHRESHKMASIYLI